MHDNLISQLPWRLKAWIYAKGAAMMAPSKWFFPLAAGAALAATLPFQFGGGDMVHAHAWVDGLVALACAAIAIPVGVNFRRRNPDARIGRRTLGVLMGAALGCSLLRIGVSDLPFQADEVQAAWAKESSNIDPASPVLKKPIFWETGPVNHMFERHCGRECVPDELSVANVIEVRPPTFEIVRQAAMFRNGMWIDLLNARDIAAFFLLDFALGWALVWGMPKVRGLRRWSPKAAVEQFAGRIEASILADPAARADLERKALRAASSKGVAGPPGNGRL